MANDKSEKMKKRYELIVNISSKLIDSKNLRLIIWLTFIVIMTIIIMPFLFPGQVNSISFSRNGEDFNVSTQSFSKDIGRMKQEVTTLEQLLTTTIIKDNNELKDSINTLIYQRKNEIRIALNLTKKLEMFSSLNGDERDHFLNEVYQFLSRKENPGFYINFGLRGQELALKNAEEKNNSLLANNEKLISKIEKLERDTLTLRIQRDQARKLYIEALSQLSTLDSVILELKEDTLKYSKTISILTTLRDDLEESKNKLLKDLSMISSVRIDGLLFKPVDVATRRDGIYKLGSLSSDKGFEVSFTLNSNKPTQLTTDTLFFILDLKNKIGETVYDTLVKIVNIGEKTEFIHKKKIDFGMGDYTVHIFYKKIYGNVPIAEGSFQARRWHQNINDNSPTGKFYNKNK